jgi:hypothetical protein
VIQNRGSGHAPPRPRPWRLALGACVAVGLGLWAGCIADTGVDLCTGDDPLPECVDGMLPNGALGATAWAAPNDGDSNGGDGGRAGGDGLQVGSDNGCNPKGLPTWDQPVATIMRDHCVRCHRAQTATYTGITQWVQNGLLRQYVAQGHYISGTDRSSVIQWIDDDAPQHACDVP